MPSRTKASEAMAIVSPCPMPSGEAWMCLDVFPEASGARGTDVTHPEKCEGKRLPTSLGVGGKQRERRQQPGQKL